MNYYERHLGDYAKQASHLSMLEHGAYTLLLDRYYTTEKAIPQTQVYRVTRAKTSAERGAVDRVLNEFFTLHEGCWTKNRCEEEILSARNRISSSQENGRKGGRPKSQQNQHEEKPAGFVSDNPPESDALNVGSKNGTQSKALQTPDSRLQSPGSSTDTQSARVSRDEGSEGKGEPLTNANSIELTDREIHEQFLQVQAAYPKRAGRTDWITAEHHYRTRIAQGDATHAEMLAGVERFAAYSDHVGDTGQKWVLSPVNFFSAVDRPWTQAYEIPEEPTRARGTVDAAEIMRIRPGEENWQ